MAAGGADLTPRQRVAHAAATLRGVPRVLRLVWEAHPGYTAALGTLNVLQGLQPVAQAWLTKLVIDAVGAGISGAPPPEAPWVETLSPWALAMGLGGVPLAPYALGLLIVWGLLTLASNALDPTSTLVQMQLGDRLAREMQTRIMVKANSFADVSYFENPSYYDSLQRAVNDANHRPINVLAGVVSMFRTSVHLVGMLGVLLAHQPVLVALAFLLALPNLVAQFRSKLEVWAITSFSVPEIRKMSYFGELLTNPNPAKEVRLFGLERFFLDRFEREFRAFHERFRTARLRHCRWEVSVSLLTSLGNVAVYAYVLWQALARRITLGDFSLLSQAVWQVHDQVAQLVRQISNLYGDILFVGQLFTFLDAPVVMEVPAAVDAKRAPERLRTGMELRDVTFCYPGTERPVLDGLNLTIRPGECVAVVGENGAGKTTLVKLLTRLYDPTGGAILVDGVDLREMDLEGWRRRSAAIFQDFSKYHLPAKQNIGLGNLPLMEDSVAVEEAARRGGAMPLVERLPEKWDTVLGRWITDGFREGAELSGGEWQKVALSRAFMRNGGNGDGTVSAPENGAEMDLGDGKQLRDGDHGGAQLSPSAPPSAFRSRDAGAQLLILDEPTAALDTQSEYDVYLRFSELTKGKATLLISHRFSTVKMADRIVVIEDGRIVEEGSHAALMARGGAYADMYEKQASRYR
jgi:ATP-binding cassette, subfamily B, bacterial